MQFEIHCYGSVIKITQNVKRVQNSFSLYTTYIKITDQNFVLPDQQKLLKEVDSN